jgi:hypothetical protein
MSSHKGGVLAKIAFEDPAECLETMSLQTAFSAPTVFTGQKLRGALLVSHAQIQMFDTVQIVFRGGGPEC